MLELKTARYRRTGMDAFLAKALQVLPDVATSPLSLLAYVVTVGAYVYIALRVSRHKNLLQHLAALPEQDRLSALESEMGSARLRSGITPEQWLRSKIHKYYFLGFIATCFTVVVVVVLVLYETHGTVDVDVTGYRGASLLERVLRRTPNLMSSAYAAEFEFADPTNGNTKGIDRKASVRYEYERKDGKLVIKPSSQYLDSLAIGEEVEGFDFWWQPFDWQFPVLSVKIVNNTDRSLLISEARIEVVGSTVDVRPVLVIKAPSYDGEFSFLNEGWGKVLSPILTVTMTEQSCAGVPATTINATLPVSEFLEGQTIDLSPRVTDSLRRKLKGAPMCVRGILSYADEDGKKYTYKFKTFVYLDELGAGLPAPPSYTYDVFLKAGKSGYVVTRELSQEIKPGWSDHFLIRIATDKSSAFDLKMTIFDAKHDVRWSGAISLNAFVPRSGAALALPDQK